jgi:hypothetical protein
MNCVTQVLEKNAEWDRIGREVLLGRRLNLPDGEKAVDRWKKGCEIVQLTPILEPLA